VFGCKVRLHLSDRHHEWSQEVRESWVWSGHGLLGVDKCRMEVAGVVCTTAGSGSEKCDCSTKNSSNTDIEEYGRRHFQHTSMYQWQWRHGRRPLKERC
jgi:hypothetical protein